MKATALIFFFSLCRIFLFAEKYVTQIKPLQGEKWYGAFTAKGYCNTALKEMSFQPYKDDEQKKDLSIDNRGNQAAPLLISNKGRYVWSEQPFAFEFKAGILILNSDFEKLDANLAELERLNPLGKAPVMPTLPLKINFFQNRVKHQML